MANSKKLQNWILDYLVCAQPGCTGKLKVLATGRSKSEAPSHGLIKCTKCEAIYPVLAGVPVVVTDAPRWMAEYRESILATLVENSGASAAALEIVDGFAKSSGPCESLRFGDDWIPLEVDESAAIPMNEKDDLFQQFVESTNANPLQDQLIALDPRRKPAAALELGCGAGTLSRALAPRVSKLLVGDISLRAVLTATKSIQQKHKKNVAPVVMDAQQIPVRPKSIGSIFSANLVDLMEEPQELFVASNRVLAKGGHLILSTPAPDLSLGNEDILDVLIEECGFEIVKQIQRIPWVRAHSSRNFQVYFTKALCAKKLG